MEKIQELVKEGKLSKNLMADKKFVDGAKEIFKSENVEMDDKKLAALMDEIEAQLKKSTSLDDKDLKEVSGGITKKGIARGAVKVIATVTGLAGGVFTGGVAGAATGIAITRKEKGDYKDVITNIVAMAGAAGGAAVGAAPGAFLGYKLGQWICKKSGLEED